MRLAIIVAREYGERAFAVISGPEIPYPQQIDRWKGLIVAKGTHDYAEIQLWTSDEGAVRRKRFREQPESSAGPVDLAQELASLDEGQLRQLAAHNNIDLTGLSERIDIITAILIAVRMEHLSLREVPGSDVTHEETENAATGDPAIFPAGPPRFDLPATDQT